MGIGSIVSGATGGIVNKNLINTVGQFGASPFLGQGMMGLGAMGIDNPLSGPTVPGAPDYVGAAEATAAGNLAGAEAATAANRASQYNPFGSSVWTQGPGGEWSQDVSFSPEQQGLYDVTQKGKMDFLSGGTPTFGENRQRVTDAMLGRVGTDIGRARDSKRSELVAQGIPVGSEAYNREMEQLDRRETDARQQAEIAATQQAGTEYGAELAGRGQQMGMLSAFSPQSPSFNQFYNQQAVPGADFSGAAQQQGQFDMNTYNQQQAKQNNMLQGLFGLGGAGIMAMSDRRLKHNIVEKGKTPSGLKVYEFSYNGSESRYLGHMSDEVKEVFPEAVVTMSNGYEAVNYGML